MRKVVSALVAAAVFAGCSGAASTAKPSTQPPAATSGAPTQAAVRQFPDGPISAGTYSFLSGIGTIAIPAGWEGCCHGYAILGDPAGLVFDNITNMVVYADSCTWKAGPNVEVDGARSAAAALSAQKGHQGTQPEQVTVVGLSGWRVRLTVPADQPTTGGHDDLRFTGCDDGTFATWGYNQEASRYQQGPGQIDEVYLVDVEGKTIAFDVVSDATISSSARAELDAMLASVKFD